MAALAWTACSSKSDGQDGSATASPDDEETSAETRTPGRTRTPTPTATTTPTATPTQVSQADPVRFRIVRFGVDAPMAGLGLIEYADGSTQMDIPYDPVTVGWYVFTQRPGTGNTVYSAHLNWYTGQYASFQNLFDLNTDDQVVVNLQDGTEISYKVVYKERYHLNSVPVGELIAPTADVRATMITCGGSFDAGSGLYDHRDVVWAALDKITSPTG
jgi:hypothetical protein